MRRLLALALAVLAWLPAETASATPRPIVYTIVLDGLDRDRVDAGKAPFISSLLAGQGGARATDFPQSRAVMLAETNPNHVAMMSGAYGGQSGIPGNAFALYQPLRNDDTCEAAGPLDTSKAPSVTSGESASCPVAQLLFEALRRQGNPDGLLTAAIFGKPKLGRIFATRRADGRARDVDHLWAPCSSGADDDDYCGSVPTNPVTGYAVDDAQVMDEVLRTVRAGIGPQRRRPDFTFVNLHQIDSAGHGAGTGTGAYDAAIAMADTQIQRLVTELKTRGEWERSVLLLVSDHSMDTTLTKTTLTSRLGSAGVPKGAFVPVQNGGAEFIYLADRASPGRFELLKKMRAAILSDPNVSEVLYREPNPVDGGEAETLGARHPAWRLAGERTGDLVVTAKPGTAFSDPSSTSNPLPGNHGGWSTRDHLFAVVGGGPFVRQARAAGLAGPMFDDALVNADQSENVDVAPTVMGLFGLAAPADSEGRFLANAFDLSSLPGAGAPAGRPRVGVRRLKGRRVQRFRLTLSPAGGSFDVLYSAGGRWRTLRQATRDTQMSLRVASRSRVRIRARLRSASGVPGPDTTRRLAKPR